jgi:serine/threonine protein kinase
MDPASQLAHKRFPTLFSVAERETQQLDYPSANLLRCVAVDAASGFPVVVSRGHSLNAISEQASHVELLQQVDSGGQIIADHYVAAVCPPLPQPSLSNPSPKPSKAKHFSCYFPAEFLNISFIFHGKYAGALRAVSAATGASVVIKRIDMRRLKNLRSNFSKLVAREKLLLQRLSNPRIPSMIRQYVDPLDDELVYFVLEDGGSSTVINLLRSSMMSSTVLQPSIIKQIMIDVRAFLFRHAAASLH